MAELIASAVKPLNDRLTELDTRAARAAPPPAPLSNDDTATEPKKVEKLTRAQLRAALRADVADSKMSEEEAEAILDEDQAQRTRATALEAAREHETVRMVTDLMAEYVKLVPDIMVEGSSDRTRLRAEIKALVAEGHPKNKSTELVALKLMYGPLESLRAARGARADAELHADGGGDNRRGTHQDHDDGEAGNVAPKDIKFQPGQKAYYQDQVAKGRYTWAQVKTELKRASPRGYRAQVH